jgi:succinate dehydrogenase/fumarate reductase flavoprotein subunit
VSPGSAPPFDADVIVIGSGAAGLVAAIAAHDAGARVLLLERAETIGGATAVSGGVIWIPLNRHMVEIGINDSREDALTYCTRLALGRAPAELIETFVDTGHEALAYLEAQTPLRCSAIPLPDYHAELPGARMGGRSVEADLYDTHELGAWRERLRKPSIFVVPLQLHEMIFEYLAYVRPTNIPWDLVSQRMRDGIAANGGALTGRLLKGLLDREVAVTVGARARRLVMRDGRVAGVEIEHNGARAEAKAARGVVLASGGFEWSDDLQTRFLPGPRSLPITPPGDDGDGLRMAVEAGADLANMAEVWGTPAAFVPGETYDGHPLSRILVAERMCPHSIIVNAAGRRFANEAAAYNDLNKAFYDFDPNTATYRNQPAWAILDAQYRAAYPVLTLLPGAPNPDWLAHDEKLEGLAARVGIDAAGLRATVDRWNDIVRDRHDPDFGRHAYAADVTAPHPTLGSIEQPPFYALPVFPGTLGTKGGPRTDVHGRVLSTGGEPIPGLYAAGNVMAATSGAGYYGAGGTIGPAVAWGYICGRAAAQDSH